MIMLIFQILLSPKWRVACVWLVLVVDSSEFIGFVRSSGCHKVCLSGTNFLNLHLSLSGLSQVPVSTLSYIVVPSEPKILAIFQVIVCGREDNHKAGEVDMG